MSPVEAESSALVEGCGIRGDVYNRRSSKRRNWVRWCAKRKRGWSVLRRAQQETGQQLEHTREELSAERARRTSIEEILSERAYTADAVQKLFNVNGERPLNVWRGFRAVGLLADYAEVQEKYERAIEQFLREELEYVVVESFDQARRRGISLLRDEMGGRATFFVDSLNNLNLGHGGR